MRQALRGKSYAEGVQALSTEGRPGAPAAADAIRNHAARGIASGAAGPLPHLDRIQAAFGAADVSGVKAHVGGPAAEASRAMGAEAYATGNHVAFREPPSLHTAAHEAAHVVQQRGGVQLKGGVGQHGDTHERHANRVADAVVAGSSAEGLLAEYGPAGQGGAGGVVQRKNETPKHDAADFEKKKDKKALARAMKTALTMTKKALNKTKKGSSTYRTYMDDGATSKSNDAAVEKRLNHVKTGFEAVKNTLETEEVVFKKWDLAEGNKIKYENTYAYVRPAEADHNMYIGGVFWEAKAKGIDSKPGVVVHELTHRVHGTVDHHYGVGASKKSAKDAPDIAIENADNYEHMAEKS